MVFGTLSTIAAAGVVGYTYMVQGGASPPPSKSDAKKIQRICVNRGLVVKEGKNTRTMQQLTRRNIEGGKEYIFRIPLGLSYSDFEKQMDALKDGLNNRKAREPITFKDVLGIRGVNDIKRLYQRESKRVKKEIEMSYDGTLRIRVFDQPLPDMFIYDENTLSQCKGWQVPVGFNRTGLIKHDFEKTAHFLVAGATDMGKSVFLKNIITTTMANQPDNATYSLIDLKGGLAFSRFSACRQVKHLAKDLEEAHFVLAEIQQDLENKMHELLINGMEDVKEAGDRQRHFIVIDEAAELASAKEVDVVTKKLKIRCESIITDIARRGRACGYRLIYATQYPTNETLRSQVRQNIGARVCFALETSAGSRAVLDQEGAELLPKIQGRAIYSKNGLETVQAPYIQNDTIKELTQPHIRIRAREERHATVIEQTDKGRSDTLLIEETGLFE